MRYSEDIQSAVECLKDKARGWSEKEEEKTWNNQKHIFILINMSSFELTDFKESIEIVNRYFNIITQ